MAETYHVKEDAMDHAEKLAAPGVAKETVSSTPNCGHVMDAQPVVDAGHDSGVGHWEGNGSDLKFVK